MARLQRIMTLALAAFLAVLPPLQASGLRGGAQAPVTVSLPTVPVASQASLPGAYTFGAAAPATIPGFSLPAFVLAASALNAPVIPGGAPAFPAGPASPTAAAETPSASPLTQLERAAQPGLPQQDAAKRQFEGTRKLSGPSLGGDGPSGGAPGPATPRPAAESKPSGLQKPSAKPPSEAEKRANWFKRLNAATHPTSKAEIWLERGLILGIGAGLVAPVLYKMAPAHTLVVNGMSALAMLVAVFGTVTVYRVARFLMGRERPPHGWLRGHHAKATMIGLALGIALGVTPTAMRTPFIVGSAAVQMPGIEVSSVRGAALQEEIQLQLSSNPAGRRILEKLRDRGGRIRIPPIFVSQQADAIATYMMRYDAIFISEYEITSRRWSVAEFLSSPEKQRQLVQEGQVSFAHELTHAAQARRSPLEAGQLSGPMEYEYEAYISEHFYTHERLKADPQADLGADLASYEEMIVDLDGYLKSLDGDPAYIKKSHIDSPYYRKFFAELHAGWPAHQLEAYGLLAQRSKITSSELARYIAAATAIAEEHGLPLPPSLQVK